MGFLPLFVAALCAAACSSDDEEGGDGGNGGGSGSLPTLSGAGITDPVTEINFVDNSGTKHSAFNYADGRMTGGSSMVDDLDFTISYNPFQITATDEGYQEVYKNIRTNAQGFITYMDIEVNDDEEPEAFDGIGISFNTEYDSYGHITRYNGRGVLTYDGVEYRNDDILTFTWRNGNMEKMEYSWKIFENGVEVESGVDRVVTLGYGDNPVSNSGIYIEELCPDLDFLSYAGFLGRPTKDIPATVTSSDDNSVKTYSVEKDEKGRIVVLNMNDSNSGASALYFGYADSPLAASPVQTAAAKVAKAGRGLVGRMKARCTKVRP